MVRDVLLAAFAGGKWQVVVVIGGFEIIGEVTYNLVRLFGVLLVLPIRIDLNRDLAQARESRLAWKVHRP